MPTVKGLIADLRKQRERDRRDFQKLRERDRNDFQRFKRQLGKELRRELAKKKNK